MIERSDSLILGILGNLDHFRHSHILLYPVVKKGWSKGLFDRINKAYGIP